MSHVGFEPMALGPKGYGRPYVSDIYKRLLLVIADPGNADML